MTSRPDPSQQVVFGVLLAERRMLTIDELRQQLPDVPLLEEAVEHLVNDGVINRLGEMVGTSLAARRAVQLNAS